MFLSLGLATIYQLGTLAYLLVTQRMPPLPWDDLLIEDYLLTTAATRVAEWY